MNDDALAYVAITLPQRAYADASTRKAWSDSFSFYEYVPLNFVVAIDAAGSYPLNDRPL